MFYNLGSCKSKFELWVLAVVYVKYSQDQLKKTSFDYLTVSINQSYTSQNFVEQYIFKIKGQNMRKFQGFN